VVEVRKKEVGSRQFISFKHAFFLSTFNSIINVVFKKSIVEQAYSHVFKVFWKRGGRGIWAWSNVFLLCRNIACTNRKKKTEGR
jgi:phosphomevalonate kinase